MKGKELIHLIKNDNMNKTIIDELNHKLNQN